MGLIREIHGDLIVPELAATSKKEVLEELAGVVQKKIPTLNADDLLAILMEREHLGSTGIGDGIAIPHGKLKDISEMIVCFGRSTKGIPFDALDGKPTHLFFLLIAPEDAAAHYLSSLAELSRFLKSSQFRSGLEQARDRDEILTIFAQAD